MNFDLSSYALGILTPFVAVLVAWLVVQVIAILQDHPWIVTWDEGHSAPWLHVTRSVKKYFGGRWSLPFGIAIRVPWDRTRKRSFYIGRYY